MVDAIPKVKRTAGMLWFGAAGLSLLLGGYCGLWIASSSESAFSACNGHFSLFADTFRCRQPYLALIATVLCIGGMVACLALARRSQKSQ